MFSRVLKPLGIVLLVVVVSMALGFRVAHPHDGLRNSLGSAKSGLVIYRQSEAVSVGQTVMVRIEESGFTMLLNITVVDGQKLQVQNGTAILQSDVPHVMGKMVAVVPFLGAILSVVGAISLTFATIY